MAVKIVKAAGLNGSKEDYFELDRENNTTEKISITVNKSGDRSILQYGDEFKVIGNSLSNWDWLMLLRQLGYEVDVIEISDAEMEDI